MAIAPPLMVTNAVVSPMQDPDLMGDPSHPDSWRGCTAQRSRGRGRCDAQAMIGTNKCRMHVGKSTAQVREEYRRKIEDAALLALGIEVGLLRDPKTPPAVRAQISDRLRQAAGLAEASRLEVTTRDGDLADLDAAARAWAAQQTPAGPDRLASQGPA